MRILEYNQLRTDRVRAAYEKICQSFASDDLTGLDLKKLRRQDLHAVGAVGPLYRAKLGYADRLIFSYLSYQGQRCVLMLEVVLGHDYAKSKFLRGAQVTEEKLSAADSETDSVPNIRYLHPEHARIHFLDRALSFDDTQSAVFASAPPMVLVGSAGSGKTALTLEKMKTFGGEVLYVTQSAFLANNAREKYFAIGAAEHPQDAEFFSYREFLETLAVMNGEELSWPYFYQWLQRVKQSAKHFDAHQLFEEIRGVLCAQTGGALTRAAYLALGVKQSIFSLEQREEVYSLFERLLVQLKLDNRYEPSIAAFERLALATPRYDFVVVDEVQDLTPAQLQLILRCKKPEGGFLLCGDSNQIVHPNFFSWAQLKTLFYQNEALALKQEVRVLQSNFRNANSTTALANQLLKIKHQRFGSIDRESNFLITPSAAIDGEVRLMNADAVSLRALNESTRQSAKVAVLVMRDEDKAAARAHFQTPLLFSIHEAKGLEYDSIILYRFVSDQRAAYAEICDGVLAEDLTGSELRYARGKDKSDKSLEIYKFYINALYVGVTRALRDVFWVESDIQHPLLQLLPLSRNTAAVSKQSSSSDEWQREAQRLAQQGKHEQAEAITRSVLKVTPVPWPVLDEPMVRALLAKNFGTAVVGDKTRRQLSDYAACYEQSELLAVINRTHYEVLEKQATTAFKQVWQPQLENYRGKRDREVLALCQRYGVNHRNAFNFTPLMLAAMTGNATLVRALLERGADLFACDNYGRIALHYCILSAHDNEALYALLAPDAIDIQFDQRMRRLDQRHTEYWLLQTALASNVTLRHNAIRVLPRHEFLRLDAMHFAMHLGRFPASVLPPEKRARTYLSGVISRNALGSSYPSSRALFERVAHGKYELNARLKVRYQSDQPWQSIIQLLNYPLLFETVGEPSEIKRACALADIALPATVHAQAAFDAHFERAAKDRPWLRLIERELAAVPVPPPPRPVRESRADFNLAAQAERERREAEQARYRAEANQRLADISANPLHKQLTHHEKVLLATLLPPDGAPEPPWGTPRARELAQQRLVHQQAKLREERAAAAKAGTVDK